MDPLVVSAYGAEQALPRTGTGPLIQISRSWYHSMSNNSKTVPDRAIFTWQTNRKSYVVYRVAPFSM